MAKVLGESARYTSQEAVNKQVRMMLHCFIMVAIAGAVEGACLVRFIPVAWFPVWLRLLAVPIAAGAFWILTKWGDKELRALEKDRAAMRRGASGEVQVGLILNDLPDEFYVINDLTTAFGNLDHVVIGPTGVFVLDAKNCRGVITADGKGELLVNGRNPEKDYVRPLIRRMLDVRDKVRVLAPGPDPFYHAVLVFTAAWVDAKWGSTGPANCIRDNQLHDYIVENKIDKRLSADEIKQIAQAFSGLAQMDEGFCRMPTESSGVRVVERFHNAGTHGGTSIKAAGCN